MNGKYLLAIALSAAAAVAACGGGGDNGSLGNGGSDPGNPGGGTNPGTPGSPGGGTTPGGGAPSTGMGGPTDPSGPTPTAHPTAKDFFIANVYPFLQSGCASCHTVGTGGAPLWMATTADGSYALQFTYGFVTPQSMLLTKPAHGGLTTNVLTAAQKNTYLQWINMENTAAPGGAPPPVDVFKKIAGCIDVTLFNNIGLGQLRTIQRTANNNTNNVTPWNENANRCTGCNQAACRDCHSSDPASTFINALGNNQFPTNYTFEQTKLANPAYLQHYFGTDALGNPVASNGIMNKSIATSKGVAYSHPYFTLTTAQTTAIDAFVKDAITKFTANTCTGNPTPAL